MSVKSLVAGFAVLSLVAAAPVQAAAQGIDDLGNTLDGEKPGKKAPPAKTPVKKTPPVKTPPVKKTSPAKTPHSGPSYVPGHEPGTRPVGGGGGSSAPAGGGITVAGNRYSSLDEYMYGMWRWRNNKGEIMHLSFFRNRTFLAFNTVTQVRVYGRFWSVANRQMYVSITRVCRFNQCRPPPRQIRRAFPTYPVSTNVVRNGSERWTRIRRY